MCVAECTFDPFFLKSPCGFQEFTLSRNSVTTCKDNLGRIFSLWHWFSELINNLHNYLTIYANTVYIVSVTYHCMSTPKLNSFNSNQYSISHIILCARNQEHLNWVVYTQVVLQSHLQEVLAGASISWNLDWVWKTHLPTFCWWLSGGLSSFLSECTHDVVAGCPQSEQCKRTQGRNLLASYAS